MEEDKEHLRLLVMSRQRSCQFSRGTNKRVTHSCVGIPKFIIISDLNFNIDNIKNVLTSNLLSRLGFRKVISRLMHSAGCTLDLMFSISKDIGDITNIPLSWSDHIHIQAKIRAFTLSYKDRCTTTADSPVETFKFMRLSVYPWRENHKAKRPASQ